MAEDGFLFSGSSELTIRNKRQVTLPSRLFRSVSPDTYLVAEIEHGEVDAEVYFRMPRKQPSRNQVQVRTSIPPATAEELGIRTDARVKLVKVRKVRQPKFNNSIEDGKFDLAAAVPSDIAVDVVAEDRIRLFRSAKTGSNTRVIEIRRYIPLTEKTGEFFGLMQAESRKQGKKLEFTNRLISEHKIFLNVCEWLGLSKEDWYYGVIHSPELSHEEIEEKQEEFAEKTGLSKEHAYTTEGKTVNDVVYQIYFPSKPLCRSMNNALRIIREEILQSMRSVRDPFCRGFVLKNLLGDGSIIGQETNLQVNISESDKSAQEDIAEMWEFFGFNTRRKDNKLHLSVDEESVRWFLRHKAFCGHEENRLELLRYVLSHENFNVRYNRLTTLSQFSTINEVAEECGVSYGTANQSLHRYRQRGLVTSERRNGKTIFSLTEEGEEFIGMMEGAREERSSLDVSNRL